MMTTTEPRFLFPKSRQFPFDEVCERIVRALDDVSWNVPGFVIEFDVYGRGEQKFRHLLSISGGDFRLRFSRPQGRIGGHWNDTAAISDVVVPGKELSVYDDESGPTLWVYVGKDWDKDKERFSKSGKYNSKLNGEPRWYLRYSGGCNCQSTNMKHTHSGRRSPLLVHDNDLGREYEPKGREPNSYRTDEVFTEFTLWLEDNVLAKILEVPRTTPNDYLPPEEFFRSRPNPWNEKLTAHLGPIYCFGGGSDAERVYQGKLDAAQLDPGDRYAFIGSGYRLMSLSTSNDGSVPEVAYDGFKWCTFGEVTAETSMDTLDVPGHYRWSDKETYVFRIKPDQVDGIYVADHTPYDKRREELFEEIKPRDHLTDAELDEATRARARTIMPIVDYALMATDPRRAFKQPIVLINRELGFDEVELVSGPWPECQYVSIIANRSPEASRLLEQALLAQKACYEDFDDVKRQAYNDAVANLGYHFIGDDEIAQATETYSRQTYHKVELGNFISRLVDAAAASRRHGLF